jgi:4-hydroxythreonine-4-phosphate dehydrogenase
VSIGCPSGVGPEVSVVAAAASRRAACVLVGDIELIREAAAQRSVAERRLVAVAGREAARQLRAGEIGVWVASSELPGPAPWGRPTAAGGAAQLAWIDEATDLVRAGVADALVTAPVSKEVIATSGSAVARAFRGHTEHLARRLGAREVVMAFHGGGISTSLATTHRPLRRVPKAITPEAVASATYWLARLLAELGKPSARLLVAGLNPHAGEGGLLGTEETQRIEPGMKLAARRLKRAGIGAELSGPVGAETAYRRAAAGQVDGVVAMFHDQATIACKLVAFGEAVNITLGLPIIRTSVDHGTGYDVAGTGRADASGMIAAMNLAATLARARRG